MSHKIYSIDTHSDYLVDITFYNGEVRRCDMKILIETYDEYRDREDLVERLSEIVIARSANEVILPNGGRIDSETLWGNAYAIRECAIMDPVINFADAMIDTRERLGMSQRDLELKSGVRQAEISKIERGEGNPSLKTMSKIFEAMGRELVFSDRKTVRDRINRSGYPVLNESVAMFLNPNKEQGSFTIEDLELLPEEVRVELINGVIYDMCVPSLPHQLIANEMTHAFWDYIRDNRGDCSVFAGPTGVFFEDSDKDLLAPDMLVICDKDKESRYKYRGILGAPDFVLEVLSPSTRNRDLSEKLAKYREKGVKEYWIIDPEKCRLIVNDWAHDDISRVYGPDDKVGVGIYDGRLVIDLKKVCGEIDSIN